MKIRFVEGYLDGTLAELIDERGEVMDTGYVCDLCLQYFTQNYEGCDVAKTCVTLYGDDRDHDAHVTAWRAECAGYWDGEERNARRYRGF